MNRIIEKCTSLLSVSKNILEVNFRANNVNIIQVREVHRYIRAPRIRYPFWYLQKERADYQENISKKNREFIQEIVKDTFGPPSVISGLNTYDLKSPLRNEPFVRGEWNIKSQRTGLIGRKIGVYPLYLNNGSAVISTLIHLADNHVIKYIPPEQFETRTAQYHCISHKKNLGCLLVGSESTDPQKFTKEYCGLFLKQGLMPKRLLARFLITSEAALPPGTPLYASHFRVGDYVDTRSVTIDRGFQGVMKRWGFHGQPATHGQTKTHRRPGCIGRGRDKRVIPGKKMPGHMGNRWRLSRGLQILRINTKYNVIWVKGQIPGSTNQMVYVYDTNVTHKLHNHHNPPHFPTFFPEDLTEPLPEEMYASQIFDFAKPSITYEVPKVVKKRR